MHKDHFLNRLCICITVCCTICVVYAYVHANTCVCVHVCIHIQVVMYVRTRACDGAGVYCMYIVDLPSSLSVNATPVGPSSSPQQGIWYNTCVCLFTSKHFCILVQAHIHAWCDLCVSNAQTPATLRTPVSILLSTGLFLVS